MGLFDFFGSPASKASKLAGEFFDQFQLFQDFCKQPGLGDEMLPALGRALLSIEPLVGDPTIVGRKDPASLKNLAAQLRNGAKVHTKPIAVLHNLLAITIEASLMGEKGLSNHQGLMNVLALSRQLYLEAKTAHYCNPQSVVQAMPT
jgi:hypothetical protein